MQKPNRHWLALVLLILAGCTTQVTVPPVDTTELESRAANALAAGNRAGALQIYRQIAASVRGSLRSGFLIEVAHLEIDLGQHAQALITLDEASANATPEQLQMVTTLLARIDFNEGRHADALARLAAIESPLTTEVLLASTEVRGQALFAVGRPVEAVRALAEREIWLDASALILENQRMIWDGLQASNAAQGLTQESGDAIVDGWLALAAVAAARADAEELRRGLLTWRIDHPGHPAASALIVDLLSLQRGLRDFPAQIALLLPLSSAAREEALAIRDGFMAAHFAAPDNLGTSIRVYDTGVEGGGEAYFRAQLEGADFIVGPLLREAVDEIATQTGFVPTLALNFAQTETTVPPASFFQFALDPEDEASAVARRAIASGARRAAVMMQSDAYGQRIYESFREEFEALGGEIIAAIPYESALRDFSPRIMSLMNIDRSYQRHRRLEANLGIDVSFEPRRRQDVDMIFLSADADDGRLLATQLEYYYAGDVPSYATSEIHSPSSETRNNDLNGIIFPDVPWLLDPDPFALEARREIRTYWPQRSSDMARFYGMGVDAYRFVPAIYRGEPFENVSGASGLMSANDRGQIRRQLPFAQFRNGVPEALPPVPELFPEVSEVVSDESGSLLLR